jgi:hypothetical protein
VFAVPRRIYLVVSAGHPNYGDELVCAQWLRYLAKREPDAEVWVDSPAPGSAELLLGHLHPHVRFTDTVFQIAWAAPTDEPAQVAHFAREAARHPGVVFRRAAGVELLHEIDVFHVLGGGYVNAIWRRHVAVLAIGSVLAGEFGARTAMSGAGLTPAAASRQLLRRLTDGYDVLDVRDDLSRELLDPRCTNSGDDVLLDLAAHLFDARPTPPYMLGLQSDLVEVGIDTLVDSVLATVAAWGAAGDQIGYVECIPGQDRIVYDLLSEDVPGIRFYPFTEIWRHGLPARAGQQWLTTRFHVHLVAAAAGATGSFIPVRPDYYETKHRSLVDLGSGWQLALPGQAAPTLPPSTDFGKRLTQLQAAKRVVADLIYR